MGAGWRSARPEGRDRWLASREGDADRAAGLHDLAGRGELAAGPVDAERDDGVAALVGRIEEAARRVETEVARLLAPGQLPADRREPAAVRVNGEDGDAVVPAVRAVDEAPGWRDADLGRGVPAAERRGKRRDDIERPQDARIRVEGV